MEVTQKQVMAMIKEFTGQANMLVAPRVFVKFTKDHISALVLNQIIYWSERTHDAEGWFYKSGDEWMEELALTRYQVGRAVNLLKQFGVEVKLKKANGAPTLHYRLNNEVFSNSFFKFLENGNSTNSKMEIRESETSDIEVSSNSLTEITSKITNKEVVVASPPPEKKQVTTTTPRAEKSEAVLIEEYFIKATTGSTGFMSANQREICKELADKGMTVERCKPGIDQTIAEMNAKFKSVGSISLCVPAIYQFDPVKPKATQPTPIKQFQKPIPFEPPKREFREEEQRLSPFQQERHNQKMAEYQREKDEAERRRLARLAQNQALSTQQQAALQA